ncbi:MAG TPA: cyclopropane fatty acyl phospholipid synthase [Candidatus Paceibacterota bacterium]
MNSREFVESILAPADVKINGSRPWDIQVHNDKLYDRVISQGTLGLGESYMDGWWDCEEMNELFYRVIISGAENKLPRTLKNITHLLKSKILNLQTKVKAKKVIEKHYDIGNNLFINMLGESMVYTCGYWKDANDLDSAQYAKLDLICKKMGLKKGMKVLDIGCGFGSFMKFATEKYGVSVVGVSLSKEQIKFGEKFCAGLPVEFRLMDYRDVKEKFDRVVSIGMFEAVGYKNFKLFMQIAKDCLVEDGLFLLHTIGRAYSTTTNEPWFHKYIFPNGVSSSIKQISAASDGLFVIEDVHNFGQYYGDTTLAWWKNFNKNWDLIKKDYDNRFYRMWRYYLLSCSGAFRARDSQVYQIVFSHNGVVGGYQSIR